MKGKRINGTSSDIMNIITVEWHAPLGFGLKEKSKRRYH
jgi:hypothetical protein